MDRVRRWSILTSVLIYLPFMMVANVIQLKVNYIVAGLMLLVSVVYFINDKKNLFLFLLLFALVVAKLLLLGPFGVKPLIVVLFGPVIFDCFSSEFDAIADSAKEVVFKCSVLFSGLVAFVVVLQGLDWIPIKIGLIEFVSTVGYDITGEYVGRVRPSAFFYHPFDTALALLPLITLAVMIGLHNKWLCAAGFLLSAIIISFLGLKILYVYFAIIVLAFILKLHRFSHPVLLYALLFSMVVGILLISSIDRDENLYDYTAGRLYIWSLMWEYFLSHVDVVTALLGYNEDILAVSPRWESEATFTPHNQYLYAVLHLGAIFFLAFLYLFWRVAAKNKMLTILIVAMFSSFAITSDLFIFLAFWVCLAQLYVMVWKVESLTLQVSELD